jgi:hypothetical protein
MFMNCDEIFETREAMETYAQEAIKFFDGDLEFYEITHQNPDHWCILYQYELKSRKIDDGCDLSFNRNEEKVMKEAEGFEDPVIVIGCRLLTTEIKVIIGE